MGRGAFSWVFRCKKIGGFWGQQLKNTYEIHRCAKKKLTRGLVRGNIRGGLEGKLLNNGKFLNSLRNCRPLCFQWCLGTGTYTIIILTIGWRLQYLVCDASLCVRLFVLGLTGL